MKKLLITSSALISTASIASIASADILLTGTAEAGFAKGTEKGALIKLHTDMDINFRAVGTTHTGFQFGATIDLDEAADLAQYGDRNTPASVFISSTALGTLTMGDTDGALDRTMTDTGMLSLITDDHTSHSGYNGNDALDGRGIGAGDSEGGSSHILRYDRQFGFFEIHISYELGEGTEIDGTRERQAPDIWGFGVDIDIEGGANSSFGLAFGAQSYRRDFLYGISGTARFSDFNIVLNYSATPEISDQSGTHVGVGVGYNATDDLAVSVNYGTYDGRIGDKDRNGWGLAVNYSLSGGAVIQGGASSGTDEARYSVGLSLNF